MVADRTGHAFHHDVVAGHLNCATLLLAAAIRLLPRGEARDFIDLAREGIDDCWADVRRAAADLVPTKLDEFGLAGLLCRYAARLTKASQVAVTFVSSGDPISLPPPVKLGLLRVAQEAVTNAIRHAGPTTVLIELAFGREGVGLKVVDDGVGFTSNRAIEHIGLRSMHRRARELKAELAILSRCGQGTQVVMTVPLKDLWPSDDQRSIRDDAARRICANRATE